MSRIPSTWEEQEEITTVSKYGQEVYDLIREQVRLEGYDLNTGAALGFFFTLLTPH